MTASSNQALEGTCSILGNVTIISYHHTQCSIELTVFGSSQMMSHQVMTKSLSRGVSGPERLVRFERANSADPHLRQYAGEIGRLKGA